MTSKHSVFSPRFGKFIHKNNNCMTSTQQSKGGNIATTPKTQDTLDLAQFNPGDHIGAWKIEQKLGQGAFGAVYMVKDKKEREYALKVEKATELVKVLKMEVYVMLELKRVHGRHFCELADRGRIGNYRYIVMTLLGPSLYDLRESYANSTTRKFSLGCALSVGMQCVEAIEDLHIAGYLHRDIKPGNFAIGKDEPRKIYMLDFGMCRRYIDPNGELRKPRIAAGFRGTIRYAPISCHVAREQTRKDDLETWLYMQVEITKGFLPWKMMDTREDVGKLKEKCRSGEAQKQMFENCPKEYIEIMQMLDNCTYYDAPNYRRIYYLLRAAMHTNNTQEVYDWEVFLAIGLD